MKKSYPSSLKTLGLVIGLLLGLSFNSTGQKQIGVDLWKNAAGTGGTVNNYPVWIKLGAPLNYTISGTTDNNGSYWDSIPNITAPVTADFITYDCIGTRIVSQVTLSPSAFVYRDTLVVSCSNLVPAIDAHLRDFRTGPASFNFFGDKKDTALPTTGIRYDYSWDFGDGQSSNGSLQLVNFVTVQHSYNTTGNYNACFSVSAFDSVLGISLFTVDSCVNVQATVANSCQADFRILNSLAGTYSFPDSSNVNIPSGGSVSYGWDFGDGSGDTTQSTVHTYQNPGNYNVCHWVVVRNAQSNIVCVDTTCKMVNYTGSTTACVADFSFSTSGAGAYFFSDSSTVGNTPVGGSVSYGWDFGNGFGANTQSASHTYATAGTYNVCHWVVLRNAQSNIVCTDTICKSVSYSSTPLCTASLIALPSGNNDVQFLAAYSKPPSAQSYVFTWDFGDGTSASLKAPIHSYQVSGTYIACVTISALDSLQDTICSVVACDTIFAGTIINTSCQANIFVQNDPLDSLGIILIDSSSISRSAIEVIESYYVIENESFLYIASGQGSVPGFVYTTQVKSPGSYLVCVYHIKKNINSGQIICIARDCGTITLPSVPSKFCQAQYIVDTANSYSSNVYIWNTSTPSNNSAIHANSYQWNFGDGNTSNQPFPVHTYANPGMYAVCLTLTSVDSTNNICTDTYCDTLGVDSLGNLIYKTTSGFTLNVLDSSAISLEELIVQEFAVYPNPANDVVSIAWNAFVSGEMKWQITDLKGAVLMKGTEDASNKKDMQLDVSRLKSGIYILSASYKNNPVGHYKIRIN